MGRAARSLADDPHLKQGLNAAAGKVAYKAVAEALGLPYTTPEEALASKGTDHIRPNKSTDVKVAFDFGPRSSCCRNLKRDQP